MKVMTIRIKSESEAMKDFAQAFDAARKRRPMKTKKGAYFASLEAVRKILTPKRLQLLRAVKAECPKSIYALAKMTRRNFSSVLKDVELLTRHGLIELTKAKRSPRRAVHARVSYDAIQLWIGI